MRTTLSGALKSAMKNKDPLAVSTLRLIQAALKDRDIAARMKGNADGISENEILSLLQSMIKQRRESIEAYKMGGRMELAEQEAGEIAIIERFLPQRMPEGEIAEAVGGVIAELEAKTLKDMGKVMEVLKERFPGSMDFGKASAMVKDKLG